MSHHQNSSKLYVFALPPSPPAFGALNFCSMSETPWEQRFAAVCHSDSTKWRWTENGELRTIWPQTRTSSKEMASFKQQTTVTRTRNQQNWKLKSQNIRHRRNPEFNPKIAHFPSLHLQLPSPATTMTTPASMGRSSVRRCAAVRFRYFWKDFQAGNLGSSQAGGLITAQIVFLISKKRGA